MNHLTRTCQKNHSVKIHKICLKDHFSFFLKKLNFFQNFICFFFFSLFKNDFGVWAVGVGREGREWSGWGVVWVRNGAVARVGGADGRGPKGGAGWRAEGVSV